ncbi:MAG TPA: STAS domain-containing protein [Pseudonocardiaceae bacterium]
MTVIRITGELDNLTVPLIVERVREQIARSPHVVIDLSGVGFLGSGCVAALRDLHKHAVERGVHWAGAREKAVTRPLELTGLHRSLPVHSLPADAVVASLRLAHLLDSPIPSGAEA